MKSLPPGLSVRDGGGDGGGGGGGECRGAPFVLTTVANAPFMGAAAFDANGNGFICVFDIPGGGGGNTGQGYNAKDDVI